MKMGSNKGNPRIWIEGQILVDHGFKRGDRFNALIRPGSLIIEAVDYGDRKVSGKGERPIIDIATKELLTVAPIGTTLWLSARQGRLELVPEAKVTNEAA